MDFSKVMHHNRDENSFTARLFEHILFPLWFKENKNKNTSFEKFLNILRSSSEQNYNAIQNKFPNTNIKPWINNDGLFFKDAMLFLEVFDLNHFCKTNNIETDIKESDKTEFDCVILCIDKNGKEHIIVFEVKCYTDLKDEEICRQNKILLTYDKKLYDAFHHFALISHDNLTNAINIFDKEHFKKCENGLYIVTWDDFKEYLEPPRFSEVDLTLAREISINGSGPNVRHLVNNKEVMS